MSSTLQVWAGISTGGCIVCGLLAAKMSHLRKLTSNRLHKDLHNAKDEQRQLKLAVDATGAQYDTLITGCGEGVIVLDTSDNIERASQEACRLLGASCSQLIGKSLLQTTLSSELHASLKQSREDTTIQRCEIRAPGINGSFMSVTILPVPVTGDGKARRLVIVNDVTELRRLETVRRDFVANVSHELRTPLTSIRAMAETLQDGALRDWEVADRFLETISTEAQRLTRISEDLLVLSHAESRTTEKLKINLTNLLHDVVMRFQKPAEAAGKVLKIESSPDLFISGNSDQIEQVVINLIDNAIKYTQSGGKICVTAESSGSMISVHVADTGIGIMSQDVSRIFERFYRVDRARSRQSGGTGLGLSIVKHIVESHGGNVTVESEYNRGSTFTFSLPQVLP